MTSLNKEIPEFSIRYLNTTSLVGIIVFCITGVAYHFGILSVTRSSFIVFDRDLKYTKGTVVSISKTSFGEGGEMAHYPVLKIGFRYRVRNVPYTNFGYTTSNDVSPGDELNISYKETDPKISKAATLKASPFGIYVLLGIVLPLAGLVLFFKGLRWGDKFVLLLKNGIIVDGHLLTVAGNGEDFKHVYAFEDKNGKKRKVALESSVKKEDKKVEILYDPNDPALAQVLNWNTLPILFGRKVVRRRLNNRESSRRPHL